MSTGDDNATELYAEINENNKKGWSNSIDKTIQHSTDDRTDYILENHIKFFSSLTFMAAINFSLFYFYYFGVSWFLFFIRKM